mgnify:FL=1
MKAFVGLGNVGDKYSKTKHNAGFWVLNEFASRKKTGFIPGHGDYVYFMLKSKQVIFVKPTTGMNNSGTAVIQIMEKWNLDLPDMFIVVDDVDLPLGSIRIRPKGGDGCHRGLENIIYQLETNDFPRIRLGIAVGESTRPSEKYVLNPFHNDDLGKVNTMVKTGADAIQNIISRGLNSTMNQFNA